jgi:allophanate hydrolase
MLTIRDYSAAYGAGASTPSSAMEQVYARIAAHDDPAVFITLAPLDDLLAQARALERRGPGGLPLYGVPVAVKDNIDIAGLPTTAACPDFAYVAERDATAVARLRAAGALIVGKTNLDQFATGLVGVRSPYGVPRNPFRADLVPGGSSSGSAVAVAAGLVPVALGTDTAGSGRVPAGLNNIVGLKPTLGAVSTAGVVPACRSLDCVSVFALTVDDAYAAYASMAGFDAADPFSRAVQAARPGAVPPAVIIGVPDGPSRRFGGDPLSEAAFDEAAARAARLGADIRALDLAPFFATAALLYEGPWVAERYVAVRALIEASPASLHPVTRSIIERARAFSAADAFAGLYRLAELKRATETAWRDIDMLMLPTFPRPRTLADLEADPIGPNSELGTYTNFVNLLDLCALAVPGGLRADGLPSGTTLVARAGQDARLAAFGAALHAAARVPLGASGKPLPPGAAAPVRAGDGQIELSVVGAHLSGLPLNGELTSRGGTFLRRVATAPDYMLFALPGGPPRRPGLLRVGQGAGYAIETEVWALDPAAFGWFVASVPPPLAIGTLRLADGTTPKGFVVESEGTIGAENISGYGGWRVFLREGAI